LTIFTPTLSTILTGFATKLTELENYETADGRYKIPQFRDNVYELSQPMRPL
jgi:hypothetical protein